MQITPITKKGTTVVQSLQEPVRIGWCEGSESTFFA